MHAHGDRRRSSARDEIDAINLVGWNRGSVHMSDRSKRPVHPPGHLQQRMDRCTAAADQFAAAWLRAAFQRRGVRVAGSAPSAIFCSTSFR